MKGKSIRYRITCGLDWSRAVIGWFLFVLICFLLWFTDHENRRLNLEIYEVRMKLNEKDRLITGLLKLNTETQQRQILERLKESNNSANK